MPDASQVCIELRACIPDLGPHSVIVSISLASEPLCQVCLLQIRQWHAPMWICVWMQSSQIMPVSARKALRAKAAALAQCTGASAGILGMPTAPSTGVEVSVLCSFSLLHDVPQQWVQPKVMAGCSGHGMQCCPVIRAGQGDAYVMPQFSVAAQEQH